MNRFGVIVCSLVTVTCLSQPNCNIYKMQNQPGCFKACSLAVEAANYQGLKRSQINFDKAIELCPTLDYAYMEKSVPYLKRGDFITWKKLIDKAVELNPRLHLGYRGWCRYQFLRDYKGAIKDFEKLASLSGGYVGYSQNGDYHLEMARALCYKAIGEKQKAITIIENLLKGKDYSPMPYDYLHLGVLKIETGDLKGGIEILQKQIAYNDYLADTYYYLAMAHKKENRFPEFQQNMTKARQFYLKGYKRTDPYTHPMDKIYLSDIEKELR
jgi:tetratricopeptide (TPR) repeat protein